MKQSGSVPTVPKGSTRKKAVIKCLVLVPKVSLVSLSLPVPGSHQASKQLLRGF